MTKFDKMNIKEVKDKIFSKTSFYNGSGYRTRYGLTDKVSPCQSSQGFIIDIPAIGFISKGRVIKNFYIYNGKGYDTFTSYEDFKNALARM